MALCCEPAPNFKKCTLAQAKCSLASFILLCRSSSVRLSKRHRAHLLPVQRISRWPDRSPGERLSRGLLSSRSLRCTAQATVTRSGQTSPTTETEVPLRLRVGVCTCARATGLGAAKVTFSGSLARSGPYLCSTGKREIHHLAPPW